MASGLNYQVAVDDSLILTNPTGVVEISASQMTEQRYPANSTSLSQIQFQNIKLSGMNSMFDSQFFLEYDLTVSADLSKGQLLPGLLFAGLSDVTSATVVADKGVRPILTSTSTNIPNICFRQLCLSSCTQSCAVALNNSNSQNYNLQQELALQDPLVENVKDRLAGLCPVDRPKSVVIPDAYTVAYASPALTITANPAGFALGQRQPNNAVWNGGRNIVNIVGTPTKAASSAVYSVVYRIREPVLADPFTCGYSGPAICNINSLSVTYSLDSSALVNAGVFCTTNNYTAALPNITGLSVSAITNANLLTRTYAVDPSVIAIPPVMYYDYNYFTFNQTPTSNAVGDQTQSSTQISLETVPKMYVAKIQALPNGLSATSTQIGSTVNQIVVQYGSMGRYVFTQQQLYEAYIRNTKVQKNFNEWLLDCEICLNLSLDLQNSAQSFVGIQNSGGLSFSVQYTYNNANQTLGGVPMPSQLYIIEMFSFAGNISVGAGVANYNTTTMSAAQLIQALDSKPMVSSKHLHAAHGVKPIQGGGIFSSIGNVLRGAVSALPGVVNTAANIANVAQGALSHPVVQSALGALGGSGGELMYSSRRRGRR